MSAGHEGPSILRMATVIGFQACGTTWQLLARFTEPLREEDLHMLLDPHPAEGIPAGGGAS